jgi:hypothetical protein
MFVSPYAQPPSHQKAEVWDPDPRSAMCVWGGARLFWGWGGGKVGQLLKPRCMLGDPSMFIIRFSRFVAGDTSFSNGMGRVSR